MISSRNTCCSARNALSASLFEICKKETIPWKLFELITVPYRNFIFNELKHIFCKLNDLLLTNCLNEAKQNILKLKLTEKNSNRC